MIAVAKIQMRTKALKRSDCDIAVFLVKMNVPNERPLARRPRESE